MTAAAQVTPPGVTAAYRHCLQLARNHYENFPVASILLPKPLRQPVAAIYAYARCADDMADEGEFPAEERIRQLQQWESMLDLAAIGTPPTNEPVFVALADTMERFELPSQLFRDLTSAFKQDVEKRRYRDFDEVLDYCRRSANPVGRLLLYLNREASEENLRASDHICSALQLINFYQDIVQDLEENDRIYFPQAEMSAVGISENDFANRRSDAVMRDFLQQQYARTEAMMLAGKPLGKRLHGRFGLEIRLIVEGGLRVLQRLKQSHDPYIRPRLRRWDYVGMFASALR